MATTPVATDADKQIRVSAGTYRLLTKMADQQGVSYKELVHLMATYFQVTKANPADPQADLPGLGIKKLTEKIDTLDKRFIGFVREQEKELLKPILSEVKATRSQLSAPTQGESAGRICNDFPSNCKRWCSSCSARPSKPIT